MTSRHDIQALPGPVDSLSFTFIVDNNVEWMSSMPPIGFYPEIVSHIKRREIVDEEKDVSVMNLNRHCCGAHGLSVLVTTKREVKTSSEYTILFDVGPDIHSFPRNVDALMTPLETVERIVISHWHVDHTGGFLPAIKLCKEAQENKKTEASPLVADLHPDRHEGRGVGKTDPKTGIVAPVMRLGDDPTFAELEEAGATIEKHAEEHWIGNESMYVSGAIPRLTSYETGIPNAFRWNVDSKQWKREEHIMDERCLIINVRERGLVIFSSCSHAGIVNVTKLAEDRFPGVPIYMLVGGFHLAGRDVEVRIKQTVNDLVAIQPKPKYILPGHCTGFKAKIALEQAFGDEVISVGSGLTVIVGGPMGC